MTDKDELPELIGVLEKLPDNVKQVIECYGEACFRLGKLKQKQIQLQKDSSVIN